MKLIPDEIIQGREWRSPRRESGRALYLEDRGKEGTSTCNRKTRSEIWEENPAVPCFEKQERYFRVTREIKYGRKNEEVEES